MNDSNKYLESRQKEEYEIQHFGFSTIDFVNLVSHNARQNTRQVIREFRKQYIMQNGDSPQFSECMKAYIQSCKPEFKEFRKNIKIYSNKYFTIPPNVLLPCDADQSVSPDLDSFKLDEEIENLERQLQNEYYMQFYLKNKEQICRTVTEKAEMQIEQIKFETNIIKDNLDQLNTDELYNTLSQIEQILDK